MCNFFSFCGDGFGNYKYLDWDFRKDNLDENCDSHTFILTHFKIPPKMQDKYSKYEYNPLTKKFIVDEPIEEHNHNHESAEVWANNFNFKNIVPQLIIKPIVNPFSLNIVDITENDILLLKKWDSVKESVRDSVWDSVWDSVKDSVRDSVKDSVRDSVKESVRDSVRDSVWDSVWDSVKESVRDSVWESVRDSVKDSVRDSVWDSVRASVRDSVRASVWAYISTFFNINYRYDFFSVNELWNRGIVPSFDGKVWRLHSGKDASIIYEWNKEE